MDEAASPRMPPLETIAGFIKLQRLFYSWKQDTLAAMAGVSLSTLQRVERGEPVRRASLEKLALALQQPMDAFTAPRVPLTDEAASALLAENLAWTEGLIPVDVARLRYETQLRQLADTEVALIASDLSEEADEEIDDLREWLDLTSFIRAEDGSLLPARERSFRLRRFYKDVFQAVDELERRHKAVCLAGTYEANSSVPGETVHVGVIAIRSRERNPACGNITRLLAESTVDMPAAMRAYFERFDR